MSENKLTVGGLAGYGVSTFIVIKSMQKICEAFGDMGLFGVISPGHALTGYAGVVGATWFIPTLCGLSFVPLIVKLVSYIPGKVMAHDYSGRQDAISQADVFQLQLAATHEDSRSNRIR